MFQVSSPKHPRSKTGSSTSIQYPVSSIQHPVNVDSQASRMSTKKCTSTQKMEQN